MRKIIRMIWPFCLSALVFLCVRIASGNSGFVEHYYSKGIYPVIAKSFSSFSRLIPFSLWDCFWVVIILLVISGLVLVLFRKIKIRLVFVANPSDCCYCSIHCFILSGVITISDQRLKPGLGGRYRKLMK